MSPTSKIEVTGVLSSLKSYKATLSYILLSFLFSKNDSKGLIRNPTQLYRSSSAKITKVRALTFCLIFRNMFTLRFPPGIYCGYVTHAIP